MNDEYMESEQERQNRRDLAGLDSNGLTLEKGRALVMQEIVEEDDKRRELVRKRLEARLVDFLQYLNEMGYLAVYDAEEGQPQSLSLSNDQEELKNLWSEAATTYLGEVLEHEDDDPIGKLAYANPDDEE